MYMYRYVYIYIYGYICMCASMPGMYRMLCQARIAAIVPLSSSYTHGRFAKFRVFVGPRPWHIEIRHRVKKKTSTINLFGFETLKLKIRRLNYGNRPHGI